MTSNCAGQPAGCTINSATGFDVASFMLGFVNTKARNLFDAGTYTEKRPEISTYVQDDFRANQQADAESRRALGRVSALDRDRGPAVELRRHDRAVRRRLRQRDDRGRQGRTSPADVLEEATSVRGFGFAYDVTGNGKTLVRGGFGVFWNFSPGGTSSSKAQNQPFLQSTSLNATPTAYGVNLLLKDGLPLPPGVNPSAPPAGATRSIFDINFRDAYARQWNLNVQRGLGKNYMVEAAYVGSQGRQMVLKVDINQAPPVVGVSDSNVNRPFITLAPGAARSEPVAEHRQGRLQRAAAEVPAPLREQLLVPELLHLRPVDRLRVGQRGGHHQHLRPRVQPGPVRLRRDAHVLVELDLRAAVGAQTSSTAAGR